MRRFIFILAAWLMCFSLISNAQNSDEVTAAFAEVAEYSARLKPVVEKMYGIVNPIDEASAIVDAFSEDTLSAETAKAKLAIVRSKKQLMMNEIEQSYAALGSPPDLTKLGDDMAKIRIGLSREDFDEMFETLNTFTDEYLNLADKTIAGDSEAVAELASKTMERAGILISIGNAQIEADIASIPTETHPQKQVLRSAINSNNASLEMIWAYYDIEVDRASYTDRIRKLEDILDIHKSLVVEGVAVQKTFQTQIKRAILISPARDRSMMRSVQKMVNAYDYAWDVERAFIASLERLLLKANESDITTYEVHELLDQFGKELSEYEEDRTRLIFERIALLQ